MYDNFEIDFAIYEKLISDGMGNWIFGVAELITIPTVYVCHLATDLLERSVRQFLIHNS